MQNLLKNLYKIRMNRIVPELAQSNNLVPKYTVRHAYYEMSARRPVKVWSLRYGCREYQVYHPQEPGHPGPGWGAIQNLTHEWDDIGPHTHDYCEITFVRGGSVLHITDHYQSRLERGDVIVAAPGQVHTLEQMDGFEETHLAFLPQWLADDLDICWAEPGVVPLFLSITLFRRPWFPKIAQFRLTEKEQSLINNERESIEHELFAPEASLAVLKFSVLKCLIILSRAFLRNEPEAEQFPIRSEIRKAMQLIEISVTQEKDIRLSDIATQVGLSHKRFDAVFKEETGSTPMEYYQNRRVQHAAHQLLNPQNTITDVAYRLGYADNAHLSNMFRRYYGMSPREYRKLYQSNTA